METDALSWLALVSQSDFDFAPAFAWSDCEARFTAIRVAAHAPVVASAQSTTIRKIRSRRRIEGIGGRLSRGCLYHSNNTRLKGLSIYFVQYSIEGDGRLTAPIQLRFHEGDFRLLRREDVLA